MTMLSDAEDLVDEREARNTYLCDLDEAWEACREAVQDARRAYEQALETGRADYEAEQAIASALHRQSIQSAWKLYKEEVGRAPSGDRGRRVVVAEARSAYASSVTRVQESFEEGITLARDDYVRALATARQRYDADIEAAFSGHRTAVGKVTRYPEVGDGPIAPAGSPIVAPEDAAPDLETATVGASRAPRGADRPAARNHPTRAAAGADARWYNRRAWTRV